jgi:hypothetical protein
MKKLSETLGVAKQSFKEKIQGVEDTSESADVKEVTRRMEVRKEDVKAVHAHLSRFSKNTVASINESKALCNALTEFANHLSQAGECPDFGTCEISSMMDDVLQPLSRTHGGFSSSLCPSSIQWKFRIIEFNLIHICVSFSMHHLD